MQAVYPDRRTLLAVTNNKNIKALFIITYKPLKPSLKRSDRRSSLPLFLSFLQKSTNLHLHVLGPVACQRLEFWLQF